jgi:hypothetical protein
MSSRQGASLWFYLGFWKNYAGKGTNKWRLPEFFKEKIWRSPYFRKDTFWTPLNKLIGCKILGHRNVKFLNEDNNYIQEFAYCFDCGTKINHWKADDPWKFSKD